MVCTSDYLEWELLWPQCTHVRNVLTGHVLELVEEDDSPLLFI